MPQHPNNREPLTREKKQGIAITVVVHVLFVLFLINVSFRVHPTMPVEVEEGLLVNFGFDQTGEGLFEPAPQVEEAPPPPISSGNEGEEEAILTQEFEEAAEVVKKEPDPEQLKREAEARAAEKKRLEELEAERRRIEQENAERLRREEEQRRLEQISSRTRNAFSRPDNTGATGENQGIAGGEGNQGVESGTEGVPNYGPGGGTGDGTISYKLGDRRAESPLPVPRYIYQEEGIVVVEISVDRDGKVTKAIAGVKGSTTLDGNLLREARDAAMKAKFEGDVNAPLLQKGTITYNFKLR